MANSELEARNVNLSVTDWREIKEYSKIIGIRGVSAALRYMLQERRNLRNVQKMHDAMTKQRDAAARLTEKRRSQS